MWGIIVTTFWAYKDIFNIQKDEKETKEVLSISELLVAMVQIMAAKLTNDTRVLENCGCILNQELHATTPTIPLRLAHKI